MEAFSVSHVEPGGKQPMTGRLRAEVEAAAVALVFAMDAVRDAGVAVETVLIAAERKGLKGAALKLDDMANSIACVEDELKDYLTAIRGSDSKADLSRTSSTAAAD